VSSSDHRAFLIEHFATPMSARATARALAGRAADQAPNKPAFPIRKNVLLMIVAFSQR
jgi:hypothetical protein